MKTAFYGLLILVCLAGCSKEKYQARGTLTGVDGSMCACCGGVFLTINNDPAVYRIDTLPFMSRQQLYALSFPKQIKFDYTVKSSCGSISKLEISSFIMR